MNSTARLNAIPRTLNPRMYLFLVVFFSFQLLFPLRYLFYSGNPCWTRECHFLSWRMMLHTRYSQLMFVATDEQTEDSWVVPVEKQMTPTQFLFFQNDPQLIRQYAQFLADRYEEERGRGLKVRVLAKSTMNDNQPQWMIYPDVNLGEESASTHTSEWIVPYGDHTEYPLPRDLQRLTRPVDDPRPAVVPPRL
ncbi:MAG: hypothetical protein CMJ46_00715 [Planctomyces sp.]|nr:hypothetical protein [Planctomyces sp.]